MTDSEPPFSLDDLWALPGRPTRALIDLDAVAHNLAVCRSMLPPPTRVMAVLKANAYGHGAPVLAKFCLESGADSVAVATVGEARDLRRHGITAPILVLGPVDPSEALDAASLEVEIAVGSTDSLLEIDRRLGAEGKSLGIHIKLETGMHRFGVGPDDLSEFESALARSRCVRVTGVYSHFARADELDEEPTERQLQLFRAMADRLGPTLPAGVPLHAANSSAVRRGIGVDLTRVRLGIALYGLGEVAFSPSHTLRPAMSIVSCVRRAFELHPGDEVSYGGTYRAERRQRAALVPIGYGDGYHRTHSGRSWMGVGGDRAPILGRVCMDQTVVSPGIGVNEGDPVGVFGPVGDGPTAAELAATIGTIDYEVVTSIASRVPRIYFSRGRVVAVDDERGVRWF